jgi:Zn-finger nucleic acid-binding protein
MRKRRKVEFPAKTVLPEVPLEPLDELPCPVCGRVMRVVRRGGVSVDTCAAHGVWLDVGELDRLLEGASDRGRRVSLARAEALAREAAWGGRWALATLVEDLVRERRRAARAALRRARR